jgi:PleD family two-component response regulator
VRRLAILQAPCSGIPFVTVSVGLGTQPAGKIDGDAGALVAVADGALYAAKRNGRNRMKAAEVEA